MKKVGILYFVEESSEIGVAGVDSEDDWKFLLHVCPKNLELMFGEMQLKFVVGLEKEVIGWDGGTTPLLLHLFVSALLGMELLPTFAHIGELL